MPCQGFYLFLWYIFPLKLMRTWRSYFL